MTIKVKVCGITDEEVLDVLQLDVRHRRQEGFRRIALLGHGVHGRGAVPGILVCGEHLLLQRAHIHGRFTAVAAGPAAAGELQGEYEQQRQQSDAQTVRSVSFMINS